MSVLASNALESLPDRLRKWLAAAVVAGAFATVPLIILLERASVPAWANVVDWIIWVTFLIDVLVAFHQYYFRRATPTGPWIAAAVLILSFPRLPAFISVVRFARVGSAVRFLRL